MGYDHFALLVVPQDVSNETLDNLERICQELRRLDEQILFGEVHHLSAGGFSDYWWQQFDNFVEQFYLKSHIEIVHLYVCEFDGESLVRHKYINGQRDPKSHEVKMRIYDPAVKSYWSMDHLEIKNNLSIFYNNKYPFECS